MDWLHHGYRAKMRVYQGTEPIDVVWFPAPKGAKVVPYPTVFGSKNWIAPITWHGIGEQQEPFACCGKRAPPWYRGNPPAPYTGQAPCGSMYAAQNGGRPGVDPPLVMNADGSATCCMLAQNPMKGGSAEGGAWMMSPFLRTASGGEAEGGAMYAGTPFNIAWQGGEAEGGNFPRLNQVLMSWTGGEAEGGNFPRLNQVMTSWSGGEAEGGNFPRLNQLVQSAAGGEGQGGSGRQFQPNVFLSAGGEGQGGAAAFNVQVQFSVGGEGQGGAGIQYAQAGQYAAGGEGQGGSAQQGQPFAVQFSVGGQGEGGSAQQYAWVLSQASAGGEGQGGAGAFVGIDQAAAGGEGQGGAALFPKVNLPTTGGEGQGGAGQQVAGFSPFVVGVTVAQVDSGGTLIPVPPGAQFLDLLVLIYTETGPNAFNPTVAAGFGSFAGSGTTNVVNTWAYNAAIGALPVPPVPWSATGGNKGTAALLLIRWEGNTTGLQSAAVSPGPAPIVLFPSVVIPLAWSMAMLTVGTQIATSVSPPAGFQLAADGSALTPGLTVWTKAPTGPGPTGLYQETLAAPTPWAALTLQLQPL